MWLFFFRLWKLPIDCGSTALRCITSRIEEPPPPRCVVVGSKCRRGALRGFACSLTGIDPAMSLAPGFCGIHSRNSLSSFSNHATICCTQSASLSRTHTTCIRVSKGMYVECWDAAVMRLHRKGKNVKLKQVIRTFFLLIGYKNGEGHVSVYRERIYRNKSSRGWISV